MLTIAIAGMKYIFVLIISLVTISCSQKLITSYTKNGVEVEKINLRLLNKHFAKKYAKDSVQYYGAMHKSVLIKEVANDRTIITQASKNNNSYTSISRTIYTNNSQEYRDFYINGRIKQKINRYLDNGENVQVAGIEIIVGGLKGKQYYYDQKGRVVENLDFDLQVYTR